MFFISSETSGKNPQFSFTANLQLTLICTWFIHQIVHCKSQNGFEKSFSSLFLEIEITNVVYIVSWFLKMKNHGGVTQFLMYDVQMMCSTLCDPNLFQENAIFFQQNFFPPPQNDRRSRSTHCFTLTNYITTEEKVLKKNLSWKKTSFSQHFFCTNFFLSEAIYFTRIFITRPSINYCLALCPRIQKTSCKEKQTRLKLHWGLIKLQLIIWIMRRCTNG